jgi:hypothetical protein
MENDFLKYEPAVESGDHPNWDMVLDHCGNAINNIGGKYLTTWIARMIRLPTLRLPYLFFHGNQNCGKSMFRYAVELLLTRGCIAADNLVVGLGYFNSELDGAIFCHLEETWPNSSTIFAQQRLTAWVTESLLTVDRKGQPRYEIPNLTHWCQMSNTAESLPRYLVAGLGENFLSIRVPDLREEIPRRILKDRLRMEAPQFMQTLMDIRFNDPRMSETIG